MDLYQYLYDESCRRAKHRVWILSDLQQSQPENTRRCLDIGISDFEALGRPAEQIWYLGDAIEGDNMPHLVAMTDLQEQAFAALGLPLCYAIGNHDCDYTNRQRPAAPQLPFWQMVHDHPGWHTTASISDRYFRTTVGDYPVYFFCDHIAPDVSWMVMHNHLRPADASGYPYTQADDDALRAQIATETHPVITAAHYGYSGCNRDHELMDHLFPLPDNVAIHFYGHSHIGDALCGRENVYRRISWVDWHDIPQIDVSSFENIRGEFCRSVLLHIYDDGSMGVFFRNHDRRCFTEAYLPARDRFPQQLTAKARLDEMWAHIMAAERTREAQRLAAQQDKKA